MSALAITLDDEPMSRDEVLEVVSPLLEEIQTLRRAIHRLSVPQGGKRQLVKLGDELSARWIAKRHKQSRKAKPLAEGVEGDCWEVKRTRKGSGGYGYSKYGPDDFGNHRISYVIHIGPLKFGEVVRHRCNRRGCWNPAHLEKGSAADNARDRNMAGRHGNGKLDPEKVRELRGLAAEGMPARLIADIYDITKKHANDVIARRCWQEVE